MTRNSEARHELESTPVSNDSEIDSQTRNIVNEMIKQNDQKRKQGTPPLSQSPVQDIKSGSNPFKRKPKAENQVIEQTPTSFKKTSLEFIELQVQETRERVKDISILEFDEGRFRTMCESSHSKRAANPRSSE